MVSWPVITCAVFLVVANYTCATIMRDLAINRAGLLMTKNRGTPRTGERRYFLKAAGASGVAGAAGLIAMAPHAARAQVASTERRLPVKWNETTDVLVVGSGFAGCAAAAAAPEGGSKVLVLEKMPAVGGNSAINLGDYAAWDSRLRLRQNLNLGEDSAARHMQDALNAGEGYNY